MYNWITLLCSRNSHNIVNQLYFNKTNLKKNFFLKARTGCLHVHTGFTRHEHHFSHLQRQQDLRSTHIKNRWCNESAGEPLA